MRAYSVVLMVLLLVIPPPLCAQKHDDLAGHNENDAVTAAIEHLRNLEYEAGKQQLRAWAETHPADLRAWNYLATATLYQEMYERGVLDSSVYGQGGDIFKANKVSIRPAFQQELLSVLDTAQNIAEQRLKQDPRDKDAMYWAGVSHGTRATYHFTLRKEYMAALHEATAAYKYHAELLKGDPRYIDCYLIVGVNNYVLGSLPWYVKVMAAMTGRHGDRAEGLKQIKRVTDEGNYARDDAKLTLAVLYQREKMYSQALALYKEMALSYTRNYLIQYETSALHHLLTEWHSAAQGYDAIMIKHRANALGFRNIPSGKILYHAGQAYEHLGENELALSRYAEAASLAGDDHYTYLAELATADLEMRLQHPDRARAHYQRIAAEKPNTDEGRSARHAIKKLESYTRE